MSIHSTQSFEVAVGSGSVGTFYGIVIALDGTGCLTKVAVGAAEDIVGTHALVGCAVAVEVVCERKGEAISSEGHVVAVLLLRLFQHAQHLFVVSARYDSDDNKGYEITNNPHVIAKIQKILSLCKQIKEL